MHNSRGFSVLTALALLVPGTARGAAGQEVCPAMPDGGAAPLDVVRYLADDRLEGRLAGSPGERCAADFIAARFRAAGLEPGGEAGSWFRGLDLASTLNPHAPGGTGRNVIGVLRGASATAGDPVVVVGAHYDHLGRGGPSSLAPDQPNAIHNGADDNASGVAALLRVAELLAADRPPLTVVFVAFTGEESGLLGSAHFIDNGGIPPDRMKAMLNMDMVGRLGAGPLIVYGVGTAAEWRDLLDRSARERGVPVVYQEDGFGPSDHTSFYARDVPVLHFFTNTHADYHRPSDDWQRIDGTGLENVAAVVGAVTRALATPRVTLTLQRGAGARPTGGGGGYGAYLGTVPDFTPVARGVLLGGVSPGSPADQAGLRKGDVLVGLGAHDVKDLQAMTDALRAHRPGDEVILRFLRDGREQRITVKLGSRSARE